jgi:hypothetical protein
MGKTLLGIWMLGCMQVASAQHVRVTPVAISGLEIVDAGSPAYDAAVRELWGASPPAELRDWLPYGIALTNHSPHAIVAVAMRWRQLQDELETGSVSSLNEAFDRADGQVPPGKTALVLPVGLRVVGSPPPSTSGLLTPFRKDGTVEAAVHGVVFASGQFVGSNDGKEFEQYLADLTVPARTAGRVLEMRDAGEPLAAVVAWLDKAQRQAINFQADGWWNATAAIETANQLLLSYKEGGEALLLKTARNLSKPPAIHLYR